MDDTYALAQWRTALTTAATTPDASVRAGAQRRMSSWLQVVDGIRSGRLRIGSRTPLRGLPAWVTPQVVRGGFATGVAAAGGDLTDAERAFADAVGAPYGRAELFAALLTEDGMRHLWSVLDSGAYRVDVPEAAALLTVAWLVRRGDVGAAVRVLDAVRPFADRLRFVPLVPAAPYDASLLWRETAGDVAAALRARKPAQRVVAMNAVLSAWNPYADALLEHWLATVVDGRVDARRPAGWTEAGTALLARFDALSAAHDVPRRHANPKENAATLRLALATAVAGTALPARVHGRLQGTVDAMVARRGAPGSARHRALREVQAADAARPTVAAVAHVVADRLASAPADAGLADTAPYLVPVTDREAAAHGVPAGADVPVVTGREVNRARAGTLDELLGSGLVPSAEVLADLAPAVTGQVLGEQYGDPALRTLVVQTYTAFRRRRTLLLLDLENQVRREELPWVAAIEGRGRTSSATRAATHGTFARLAGDALNYWPGTLLPNPLVAELTSLADAAGIALPLVEEIAADIFEGRFSRKFADAGDLASEVLAGRLYARYYGLPAPGEGPTSPQEFSARCQERARTPGHAWCTVCNGMVVEQAQVLTTHNLVALHVAGVEPPGGWRRAAEVTLHRVLWLLDRLGDNRQPQRMLKDLAYAWRQWLFFLSLLDPAARTSVIAAARDTGRRRAPFTAVRMAALLDGLERPGEQAPLLGWTHGRHPLLDGTAASADRRA